jgi:glycosyltransferase involved in cell wall biosynthesis
MLVDPMNIKEIKEVVARIVTTPELQEKLKEKGLSRAKQFDWSMSANIYYDVLKSTIDSSDRRDLNYNREIG